MLERWSMYAIVLAATCASSTAFAFPTSRLIYARAESAASCPDEPAPSLDQAPTSFECNSWLLEEGFAMPFVDVPVVSGIFSLQLALLEYWRPWCELQSPRKSLRFDTPIPWLLDGDPAIRWQTLRDLVGAPKNVVERE